ncbi:MAG: DUF3160 domain-containing protein, partial [Patescibacteria group bacterium]|nr:DUF3160 domain-containing protein [Patescibacteria group bacterium]
MDQKDIKPDLANKNLLAQNINNIKNMNKANKRSNLKIILLFIALIFVITSAAGAILIAKHKIDIGNKQARQDNSLINKKDNQSEPIIGDAWQFNLIKPAFAGYRETTTDIIPALANTHAELSTAENLASFSDEGIEFSDEQKKLLNKNGFVLAENNIIKDQADFSAKDDFIDMYDNFDGSNNLYYREPNDAVFITSDLALHLYHILIDRSFQRIEETKFQPMLRAMSEALFSDSLKKYNAAKNNDLKNSYKRLSAYYLIPLTILNAGNQSAELDIKPEAYETYAQYLEAMNNAQIKNSSNNLNFYLSKETDANINLSQEIYELAEAELQLINNAKGLAASPLFTPIRPEFLNDYSQFKPRSHYTKNDILKSYFIAMMWYGRMGFTLNSPELTRDALLITGQINNLETAAGKLSKIWSDMMAIIDFFVGEVDDLTAFQYTDIIKKVYGENVNEGQFFDENLLQKFKQTAIQDLPLPKILSEAILMENYDSQTKEELLASTLQFRFMGQRFTPDAYIINKLTQGDEAPDPKTGQR